MFINESGGSQTQNKKLALLLRYVQNAFANSANNSAFIDRYKIIPNNKAVISCSLVMMLFSFKSISKLLMDFRLSELAFFVYFNTKSVELQQ